jgi:hypothetical protein
MKNGKETFASSDKVIFLNQKILPKKTYSVMAITDIPRNMCVCGLSFEDPNHSCDNPTLLREAIGHHQRIYLNLTGLPPLTAVTGDLLKKVNN